MERFDADDAGEANEDKEESLAEDAEKCNANDHSRCGPKGNVHAEQKYDERRMMKQQPQTAQTQKMALMRQLKEHAMKSTHVSRQHKLRTTQRAHAQSTSATKAEVADST